ncbi:MAG: hypothetical protein H7Z38_16235 [Rubrivivax sp.]|nr:hypothetical protein [Pyrinomonadaceae bacterium]
MVDKKSSKKRTQVKDLPKKEKKLSTGDMKKVKGGAAYIKFDGIDGEIISKKPGTTK